MKTYSDNINKAYNSYLKVMDNNDTSGTHSDMDYKRMMRNINRAYDKFVKACEAEELNHMTVSSDFIPSTIVIGKKN